jgi:hypothetical protein
MSLIRQRVPTAKKLDELYKASKQKRKHLLKYRILCKGCGEAFDAALVRAKYCSKTCKWRTNSRGRVRNYETRRCEQCSKEIIVRQDVDTNRCRECFCKNESEFAKKRPRHPAGYYMPGVSIASIKKPCFD